MASWRPKLYQNDIAEDVRKIVRITTTYQYDEDLDRLESVSKVADGKTITNSYSYENDRIKTITHNGFNYGFGYDKLGNSTTVDVGSQNLITNNYEANTSKLLSSVYGNNQKSAMIMII